MPIWPTSQPGLDLRGFMGGIIVHHQMHLRALRYTAVDLFQEIQELLCPVTFVAFANDEARGNIKRCKQRGGSMAHAIVGTSFNYALHHLKNRLLPVQGLDLALLVNTQDNRAIGWGQI